MRPFLPLLKWSPPAGRRRRKLGRLRAAGADPARAPGRAANGVLASSRSPCEPLPAGRPHADRPGHANRQRHRAGQRLVEHLRRQSIILPALNAIERASAEAITRANRRIYDALAEPLSDHRRRLDELLKRRTTVNDLAGLAAPVAHQAELGTCWNTSNA